MNPRKLQAIGITLGIALFVATGLLVFTAADRPVRTVSDTSVASIRALSDTFAEVAEKVSPAVVSVHSERITRLRRGDQQLPFGDDFPFRFFFGEQPPGNQRENRVPQQGVGSGVIIDKEGHIVTNHHVVRDVDKIKVTLADKRTFDAELVGADPKSDLAVIRIKDKVRDLPVATLGDSDVLRIGDWVLAVGAPFGYATTVTAGIISAKGRANVGVADYEDFIQTDAAINPGNSGGPLVNLHGEVIGINTAIATRSGQFAGVGFAIPANMAKGIIQELLSGRTVSRGLLGVSIQDVEQDLAQQFGLADNRGALITQITPDSAAAKAGFQIGDVVRRYNGRVVEDTRSLRNLVAATAPKSVVEVVVIRNGKELTLKPQIGEQTAAVLAAGRAPEESTGDLGLTVQPLTESKANDLGLVGETGVLIIEIKDNSPAAAAALQPGDLITEINREKITNLDEFRGALAKAKDKDALLMLVKRGGGSRFVIVRRN